MNIVVVDGETLNPGDLNWKGLKNLGNVEIFSSTSPHQVIERCKTAQAVITNKVVFNADVISQLPLLKYIGISATGTNNVDIEFAKSKGITVKNAANYSTMSVAQHVFALLFQIVNQVSVHNNSVKNGNWSKSKQWTFWQHPPIELAGKTMGIIGFGTIGEQVANIALSLGMNVLAYNRSPKKTTQNISFVSIQELVRQADVISLHTALTSENFEMVDADFLSKMKKTSILINTARGGLINEQDLFDALSNNAIYAAVLDVMEQEPPPENHPLLGIENCIITPHIAWASKASRQRLLNIVTQNLENWIVDFS